MLFYGGELDGVRALLTEAAYVAQVQLRAHEAAHSDSDCTCGRNQVNKWNLQLIAGTMTFISVEQMKQQPHLSRYHTGTHEFADSLAKLCGVKRAEVAVDIPFTTDDRAENEALLREGYRPRFALVQSLLDDSLRLKKPKTFVVSGRVESSA